MPLTNLEPPEIQLNYWAFAHEMHANIDTAHIEGLRPVG
jgi:hypothetical protein